MYAGNVAVKDCYNGSEMAFDIIKSMSNFIYKLIEQTNLAQQGDCSIDTKFMKDEASDIISSIGELLGFGEKEYYSEEYPSRFYYIINDVVKDKDNNTPYWNWCYKVIAKFSIDGIKDISKDRLMKGFIKSCRDTTYEYSRLILIEDDIEPWLNEIKEYFSLISFVLHTVVLSEDIRAELKECRDKILNAIREKNYSLTGFLLYNTRAR